jgi:Histidine kinase
MAAFITIVIHYAVSYLHVLFAWRFYSRRHEDYSIYIFWIMLSLWAVMHALYGSALLLDELDIQNFVYFSMVILAYSLLPFMTVMLVPIFIGELTVAPKKPNPVASILLLLSRHVRIVFLIAVGLASADVIWSLQHLYPLEQWAGEFGNIKALYGLFVFGAVWLLMLASGIRPDARWSDLGPALRVLFVLLLILWTYQYFIGFSDYWSVGPVLSTLGFTFVLSWYRFRLQFIDMILNQCAGIVMLVVAVLGLGHIVSITISMESSVQNLVLFSYVLIAGLCFRIVSQWFSLLWAPPERILAQMHTELPIRLANCIDEETAIAETEKFIGAVFHCDTAVNRTGAFNLANRLQLSGDPGIEVRLGYIRGWIPWLSQANNGVRTAAMYLQSHLQIQTSHANSMKAEELSTLATRAELDAMRAQIRPHFLFNTLNSIHSFVRDDPAQAEIVIEQLSELMRSVLTSPDEDMIPLEKELNTVKNYLAIEKTRYGERLCYEIIVPQALLNWMVPPFSIQPIVENVIKHGVDAQFEPVTLSIEASVSARQLEIHVIDDGPGFSRTGQGLGIATKNIRERLKRLYGDEANLVLAKNEAGGVTASLSLPDEARGKA